MSKYDKVDFMADEDDGPLSLVYIKLHRTVVEVFMERQLSTTTRNVFFYLCFNSLVRQGVSHRFDVGEIAEFVGKHFSTVYRSLAELEEAGLIKLRDGNTVCSIPSLVLSNVEAKTRGRNNKEQQEAAAFLAEVAKHERVLGRTLSKTERARLRHVLDAAETT